jgi:hypothetical protein
MTDQELAELDLAVARADGTFLPPYGVAVSDEREVINIGEYQPTRDRAEAQRLQEKYQLEVSPWLDPYGKPTGDWRARATNEFSQRGPTPAIAICRAVVALKGPTTEDRH